MAGEKIVRAISAEVPAFQNSFKRACRDPQRKSQIFSAIGSLLLLDLDQPPAKLHLHQLTGKKVASALEKGKQVPVWTLHVTPDDRYKASFTFEGGVVYLRLVDEHDMIDKNP